MALMMLSAGVPMITGGDEFCARSATTTPTTSTPRQLAELDSWSTDQTNFQYLHSAA
jgi:hypothetical protein